MTADPAPLPEPEQPADAIFYLDGVDLFTADQMHAFRAEGERLARLQALEDAALLCRLRHAEWLAVARSDPQDDGASIARAAMAEECADDINALKDRK